MKSIATLVIGFSMILTSAAQALAAGADITESTDPARAAAVEKLARQLSTRAAADPAEQSADGLQRGRSPAGIAYVGGGIGTEQLNALSAQRAGYSLWIATVAQGSGAYLSDVVIRISDVDAKRVVLDLTLYGPWLFVALPPGHYEISATLPAEAVALSQVQATRVTVVQGAQRQAVFRFVSAAQVERAPGSPAADNPFNAPPPKH
ncbi:MAG: hypothetical protein KGM91_25020 [Burkholderiales bacterium]|nr:hypothetical protein [Burkholderiales bacterium]